MGEGWRNRSDLSFSFCISSQGSEPAVILESGQFILPTLQFPVSSRCIQELYHAVVRLVPVPFA